MGIKDSLITMMGDFVELKRNPEFRSKTDVTAAGTSGGLPPGFKPGRRHSLNITVGTVGFALNIAHSSIDCLSKLPLQVSSRRL